MFRSGPRALAVFSEYDLVIAPLDNRIAPGLFLCGEMLDAFGPIGGYNFAWACATGRLAGLGASSTPLETIGRARTDV